MAVARTAEASVEEAEAASEAVRTVEASAVRTTEGRIITDRITVAGAGL